VAANSAELLTLVKAMIKFDLHKIGSENFTSHFDIVSVELHGLDFQLFLHDRSPRLLLTDQSPCNTAMTEASGAYIDLVDSCSTRIHLHQRIDKCTAKSSHKYLLWALPAGLYGRRYERRRTQAQSQKLMQLTFRNGSPCFYACTMAFSAAAEVHTRAFRAKQKAVL
jgi:hypothetical protein